MKIQANELRIGNLVTINNPEFHPQLKGIILEVTSIHESSNREGYEYGIGLKHINQKPNTYYETYSQFLRFVEGIPLTEKIIVDAKFPRIEWIEKSYRGKYAKFHIDGMLYYFFTDKGIIEKHGSNQEYETLHEFQNLIHSLTGEELKLL